jgi:hypothetical protein
MHTCRLGNQKIIRILRSNTLLLSAEGDTLHCPSQGSFQVQTRTLDAEQYVVPEGGTLVLCQKCKGK